MKYIELRCRKFVKFKSWWWAVWICSADVQVATDFVCIVFTCMLYVLRSHRTTT